MRQAIQTRKPRISAKRSAATNTPIPKGSDFVRRRVLVARFTDCPEYDIKRGWSASMDYSGKTKNEALFSFMDEHPEIDPDSVSVGYHSVHKVWVVVHHRDGLSCWRLKASTEAEAIAEARQACVSGKIERAGFGDVTLGRVELVAKLDVRDSGGNPLCVFSCDGIDPEGAVTENMRRELSGALRVSGY